MKDDTAPWLIKIYLVLVDDGAEQEEKVSGGGEDEVGDHQPEEDRGRAKILARALLGSSPAITLPK